jgi:hypothetical protein
MNIATHRLVALVHELRWHLAYIPWKMAIFVDDNIYNVHRKEIAEGNPVVEITRTFLCSQLSAQMYISK